MKLDSNSTAKDVMSSFNPNSFDMKPGDIKLVDSNVFIPGNTRPN
jgi:hypothetical protein